MEVFLLVLPVSVSFVSDKERFFSDRISHWTLLQKPFAKYNCVKTRKKSDISGDGGGILSGAFHIILKLVTSH